MGCGSVNPYSWLGLLYTFLDAWIKYLMTDLLRNSYTLIAGVVTVCTLGSMGGVSLYIINQGFADQRDVKRRVDTLESVLPSRAEIDRYHEKELKRLELEIKELEAKLDHVKSSERYEDE